MENDVTEINQPVQVVARYGGSGDSAACFPVKMRLSGREYVFTELGLRHPTIKGRRMVHVFDMSDGAADYRLEFDAESLRWTLCYVADKAYAAAT